MNDSAQRILELLAVLGVRQNEFARRIGVGASYVSDLKNGAKPSNLLISAVACIYKVNRAWLETGEGEMFAGEANPILAQKSDVEVIVACQRHIAELNKEVVRLRKEVSRLTRKGAKEQEKSQHVRD